MCRSARAYSIRHYSEFSFLHQGGQMAREANDYVRWHEAYPRESMVDQELGLAHHGVLKDWPKAPAKAGNYRPTPQLEAPSDTQDRGSNFLQENFLLLFPISLFL